MGSRPETVRNLFPYTVNIANMISTKVTTLLLDCDNTLVQSEFLAFEASADLTNEIFAASKVDLSFTGNYLQCEFVSGSNRVLSSTLENLT
jgi:hypothetical protein